MGALFERFRTGRINRSEVIAAVTQWRQYNAASSPANVALLRCMAARYTRAKSFSPKPISALQQSRPGLMQ
jgi:hypothetical protein